MKKYSDEKKKMFRDWFKMEEFAKKIRGEGSKVISVGFMPVRTYRNFGYKYGVVYKEKFREKV